MSPSTNQFRWKDRDTAAHDLLQLVYHAPSSIARLALNLLEAIRAPSIVDQLLDIVEDDRRDMWQRIYALRAISATPGDWFLPQLENRMKTILRKREAILENHPHPDRAYLGNDLLDDIRGLAAYHPSNRGWFFATLDGVSSPIAARRFLEGAILHVQPEEFGILLIQQLLKSLNDNPEQITASVVSNLTFLEDMNVQTWLEQHVEDIVRIVSADTTDPDVLSAADQWEKLRERLIQVDDGFESRLNVYIAELEAGRQQARIRRKEDLPDYQLSPAYQYLKDLYQRAADGDISAFRGLVRIARKWRGNIPLRAVATHFIGKLDHGHIVTDTLCHLMKHAQDDWGNDEAPLSPIRAEAGEALKDTASPEVWMVMVDAFFVNPRNVLAGFMIDWITHLTDQLDGVHTAYAGAWWGNEGNRRWFRAMSEISEEQLQQMIP